MTLESTKMETIIKLSKEDVARIVGEHFGIKNAWVEIVDQIRYVQVPAHLYGPGFDSRLKQDQDDTLIIIHKKC